MSLREAVDHQPKKPTNIIRIFPSLSIKTPLRYSYLYKKIVEYTFDDNDTYPFNFEVGPLWFDEKIAEAIINDFMGYRKGVEALVVHCSMGQNRSPAVAISLNEIFELGQNSDLLKQKFNRYNHHVYNTMIEAAQRLLQNLIKST